MKFPIHIVLFFVFAHASIFAQEKKIPSVPVFMNSSSPWADSVFQTLSLEQKIGQLFMVATWSDPNHQSYNASAIDALISNYGIGGIIFFQGSPGRQANLTNRFQSESRVPLMIGMDAEWGLGMRLDSTIAFPRQMTMGAVQDENLIYEYGREMARQCKRLGVHVSFSPVVDINNNPNNPVISNRSFGENRELVTRYGYQYMKGLQDGGVLANAKHFPGHGDTDADSHHNLPVIPYSLERLDSLELYPYYKLIQEGLGSVMIAHLFVPQLDSTPNTPSTLSSKIVHDLLQEKMGFKGLVFTDALNMQGVAKYYEPGEVDLKALQAGNDVLLYSLNVAKAIEKIKMAVDSGLVAQSVIDEKCMKMLRAKEWAGLNKMKPVNTKQLVEELNTPYALNLKKRIIESSITVMRNNGSIAPLCHSDVSRVAVVSIGDAAENPFSQTIAKYAKVDLFSMEKEPDFNSSIAWQDKLSSYDLVIAAVLNTSNKATKNFGVSGESVKVLNTIGGKTDVVLAVFANPYAMNSFKELDNVQSIVVSYQDDAITQQVTAEVISGACTADGKLPVSIAAGFNQGQGVGMDKPTRLRWVNPSYLGICTQTAAKAGNKKGTKVEQLILKNPSGAYQEDMMSDKNRNDVELDERCFAKIDSIAQNGITAGAYPGCRVLLAKNGYVVYDKAFGHLDYDKSEKVTLNTVYDLASVTKLVSSTLCAMKLVDQGLLDVHKTLGDYLNIPKDSPYAKVEIAAMLSHTAGFTAWIPFYQKTMNGDDLDGNIYKKVEEKGYSHQVASGMFIADNYGDVMFETILKTPISSEKTYKYSDLGYYFMQRIIEKQTGVSIEEYVRSSFYEPMGLQTIGYNPLKKMNASYVAPTEDDGVWRDQHVRGYVHDQGAAMLGGIAGHAGVFSNAQDVAAIMQMLLNGGSYAGKQLLNKETIDLFNHRHFPGNRRGLGFDKPSLTPGTGSTCKEASAQSFGHTGFTGTMCWADPETQMVYVFLSNRVNPDAENKKIQSMDIRTKIQAVAYSVLGFKAE